MNNETIDVCKGIIEEYLKMEIKATIKEKLGDKYIPDKTEIVHTKFYG